MKPLLAAFACVITATVVSAQILNDEFTINEPGAAQADSAPDYIIKASLSKLQPTAFGLMGAAAFALLIAARRAGEHGRA